MEWDVPISVFGVTVRPGQLIHADQHGFLVIPEEDEAKLEEATSFMDRHLIIFSITLSYHSDILITRQAPAHITITLSYIRVISLSMDRHLIIL